MAYRRLFRKDHFYNSGVVGIPRHHDIIDLWISETQELHAQLRGDQEILNLAIYQNQIPVIALPDGYHQLRLDGFNPSATIMHWTGPTGKEKIRRDISDNTSLQLQ